MKSSLYIKNNQGASIKLFVRLFLLVFLLLNTNFQIFSQSNGRIFYIDSNQGNDSNSGLSPQLAWQSLQKVGEVVLAPGDKILLSMGCTFYGKLQLKGGGSESDPVIVSAYDSGNGNTSLPVINAEGYVAAVQITNGKNIEVSNLELTTDAGTPIDSLARTERYGIWVTADETGLYPNLRLANLKIHHIFATENIVLPNILGANPTSNMGMGITISMQNKDAIIKNVSIENCVIEMTGNRGIHVNGSGTILDNLKILNTSLTNIGGPGMVLARCNEVLVRGNVVDHSGSSADPRMHARGSGIWPWGSNNVLIERNKFMHARGINDSAGAHIDFNCRNVIIQYNLSIDNEGGFVEILGNNYNCAYRYNISINDGSRVKGENGARGDGRIIWTHGFRGVGNKREGPVNSYIYNNTIFVKEGSRSVFSLANTTDGILIANNIFYILGETLSVPVHEGEPTLRDSSPISNVVFTNNLYENANILPESLPIKDNNPFIGNPEFRNAGGVNPYDYIPGNTSNVKNKGIEIKKLPGDEIGLFRGLKVETDFLGNPIKGLPDIGAIEIQ
jgi:hypothetical protein